MPEAFLANRKTTCEIPHPGIEKHFCYLSFFSLNLINLNKPDLQTKLLFMKQFIFIVMAALVITSCNSGKQKIETKNADGSTTKTEVDVKGMQSAMDEGTKRMEELKKLPALTLEQLRALLPEELDGVKGKNYNASTQFGYATATIDYRKNDSTDLKVNLFDCAGEAGSGFYYATYWGAMNYAQETDDEYTKTIDFMDGKAILKYRKDGSNSNLTYLVNKRLLVTLDGDHMTPDEIKAAAQKLNLKVS
jgi:hypothetical protein